MQEQEHETLCSNGCGFFGNAASGGMCSVCYKKTLSDKQTLNSSSQNSSKKIVVVEPQQPSSDVDPPLDTACCQNQPKPVTPQQKNRKRCWSCKKKVGYTGIECRCGFVFCGQHRYADQHACAFDYKTSDRQALQIKNPGGGAFAKLDKV